MLLSYSLATLPVCFHRKKPRRQVAGLRGRTPKMIGSGLAIGPFGGNLRQKIQGTRACDLSFKSLENPDHRSGARQNGMRGDTRCTRKIWGTPPAIEAFLETRRRVKGHSLQMKVLQSTLTQRDMSRFLVLKLLGLRFPQNRQNASPGPYRSLQ